MQHLEFCDVKNSEFQGLPVDASMRGNIGTDVLPAKQKNSVGVYIWTWVHFSFTL